MATFHLSCFVCTFGCSLGLSNSHGMRQWARTWHYYSLLTTGHEMTANRARKMHPTCGYTFIYILASKSLIMCTDIPGAKVHVRWLTLISLSACSFYLSSLPKFLFASLLMSISTSSMTPGKPLDLESQKSKLQVKPLRISLKPGQNSHNQPLHKVIWSMSFGT